MSGGQFSYLDSQLKHEIFGWSDKPGNVFEDKEISALAWDLLDLIHEFDWYVSGDNSEEDYLQAKREFKAKWLAHDSARCRQIVDEAIAEVRAELYKTFDIEEKKFEDHT